MKIIASYCHKTYRKLSNMLGVFHGRKPASLNFASGLKKDTLTLSEEAKAAAKNSYISDLVNLNLKKDGAIIPPVNPANLDPDSLCMVHMTDYMPQNGYILSIREAMQLDKKVAPIRNTVHFSLNHVFKALDSDWSNVKYTVLMPFKAAMKANPKGKFEGVANNIFSNGAVAMPDGTVLLKHNKGISSGQYKVSLYPNKPEIKVIETSESLCEAVNNILKNMGFTKTSVSNTLGVFDDNITKTRDEKHLQAILTNHKGWLKFAEEQGIKPITYTASPNRSAESILNLMMLLKPPNKWTLDGIDVKKIYVDTLEEIRSDAEKHGFFLSFDTVKFSEIIKNAKTPNEALKTVETEMRLKPDYDLNDIYTINPKTLDSFVIGESTSYQRFAKEQIEFFAKNPEEIELKEIKWSL